MVDDIKIKRNVSLFFPPLSFSCSPLCIILLYFIFTSSLGVIWRLLGIVKSKPVHMSDLVVVLTRFS